MKKKKYIFLSLIIVLFLIFIFLFDRTEEKVTMKKFDKTIPIKILVMDKDKTTKDINLDQANDGDIDQILYFSITTAYLNLDGENYIAKLDNINNKIFDNVTDYVFAKNNSLGEVIDDATFNQKTKQLIIPKKYFETEEKEPVQFEVQTRMTERELKNLNVKVKVSSFGKKGKVVKSDGRDVTTAISVTGYGTGVTIPKKDINVYLNNKSVKLKKDDFDWDARSGVITIANTALNINDVYVTISKKNIFSKFLNIKIASAATTYNSMKVYATLSEKPDEKIWVKDYISYENRNVDYVVNTTTNHKACPDLLQADDKNYNRNINSNDKWSKRKACVSGWKYMYGWSGDYDASYWRDDNNKGSVASIADPDEDGKAEEEVYTTFMLNLKNQVAGKEFLSKAYTSNVWISLLCFHPGVGLTVGSDEYNAELAESNKDYGNKVGNTEVKVLKRTDTYIVLGFKTNQSHGQNGFGIYKFDWNDSPCGRLKVQKEFEDDENVDKSGIYFHLWDNENDCKYYATDPKEAKKRASYIGYEVTNEDGVAIFEDLQLSDEDETESFYVREGKMGNLDLNQWSKNSKCYKINIKDDDASDGKCKLKTKIITNYKKKYCVKVKKKDADTGNQLNSDFEFGIKISGATDYLKTLKLSSPTYIGTFSNLSYKDYTIKETTENGKRVGTVQYWNDSGDATIKKEKLTAMTTDEEGKPNSCPANAYTVEAPDHAYYYCLKVKKIDSTTGEIPTDEKGNILETKFKIKQGDTEYEKTTTNGIATFMLGTAGGSYTVTEEEAPKGYAKSSASLPVNATLMPKGTTKTNSEKIENCNASDDSFKFPDSKLVLNWYKVTENGTGENGAKFKLKIGDSYVTVKADKESQTDSNSVVKNCYVYSGVSSTGSVLESYNAGAMNGEVCIMNLPEGNYTAIETKPGSYHTFGSTTIKNLTTSTEFKGIDLTENVSNRFINYPTYFEFTKTASKTDLQSNDVVGTEYYNKTTEELKKIEFNIIDSSNNVLSFIQITDSDNNRLYSYAGNTIDKPVGTPVTALYLDDLRKIRVEHLPEGTYSIKEKNTKTCDSSSSYTNCIGYYYPEYTNTSDYQFTITDCSSVNATSCGTANAKPATKTLNNEPTVIEFTKEDFYNYEDASDIVNFETDEERNDFDRIDFKIKDSSGNYLTLQEVGTSGTCLTDDSYREYRYVVGGEQVSGGSILHTCGGHIKITNLCRGNTYTVEEVAVPENSVFVKENTQSTPTEVSYRIPCKKGEITQTSNTNLISDKGTRVRFEKRDSKYNYLIPDETTTFEVYRCAKGVECHPTDNKDENGKILESSDYQLIKFTERAVMNEDKEDDKDAAGLAGVEVYKAMSDSDVQAGKKYVTQLHPYNGILVLRYLQSGYNYVLVETVAPKNYTLPIGRNAETNFTVTNETVSVEEVDVPNKPTSILIKKYSSDGNLLTGAQFKIYEGTTCDANLSAMNQPKVELKLKTIRDGVYENRPNQDTSVITTCTDKEDSKCSDIPVNEVTKLTYTDYLGTWTNFENTITEDGIKIELKEGEAIIQYLEYGHCYIIEEIKAPKGYSLPKNEDDRFTMITIKENDSYAHDTGKTLVNTPTPFTFYKFDEFNKLLDGAEFKLQKLDNNKKYHDVTVSKDEEKEGNYYKVDDNTTNIIINTINGSATVYYLSAGQYRIVETKAAPGKELTKNPNIATFFVDESGNVFGNSIIVNKGKTEKIQRVSSAKAELIVNIQTGQTVIKYGLIIAILLAAITVLIILKKKTK